MLLESKAGRVPVATYQALQMLSYEWMESRGGRHLVLPVKIRKNGRGLISLFALKRPDGAISLLVINKDATHPATLSIKGVSEELHTVTTYSSACYSWHADGANGYPSRHLPPSSKMLTPNQLITIPPWSLSVLR